MAIEPIYQASAEDARKMLDGTITEKEWRFQVMQMMDLYGWEVILHIPDRLYQVVAQAARTDKSLVPAAAAIKGFPDLFIGHRTRGQHLFLELKKEDGQPSLFQREKFGLIWGSGLSGGYFQPHDFDMLNEFLRGKK